MKRAGAIMMLISLAIILFVAVPQQFKFFLGGFGIGGGLVLMILPNFDNMENK